MARKIRHDAAMNTMDPATGLTPSAETDAARRRRIAWEAERIAEADTEIEAGLFVDSAEVHAWMDSFGTEHELPIPRPRR